MKYSPLIRHLVKATGEARIAGEDLASRLSQRFLGESDIIRKSLFHAVCDPRFMLHAVGTMKWTRLAKKHLEAFATKLMKIDGLTTEIALELLDECLNEWFMLMMDDINTDQEFKTYSEKLVEENNKREDKLEKTLNQFMKQIDPQIKEEDQETTEDQKVTEDEELTEDENEEEYEVEKDEFGNEYEECGGMNDSKKYDNETTDDKNDDENKGNEVDRDELGKEDDEDVEDEIENPHFGRCGGKGCREKIKNRFLKKLPQSLLELVKRIGRTGDDIFETSGSFLTASKSDIIGITVGNDLNSVLPSELALLSHPNTENIFLNNFVSKRLQVFASASSGCKAGKKHENGPIIICLDTSGSMHGEPIIVAKALTMAISIIAQRQKRKVILVKYSDSYEGMVIEKFSRQLVLVKRFLSEFESGGNNENKMFGWLFNDLLPSVNKNFKSADILCITDFGWNRICNETMNVIQAYKNQGMLWYGLNINPGLFTLREDEQCTQLIDSLWNYKNGQCMEVKNENAYS